MPTSLKEEIYSVIRDVIPDKSIVLSDETPLLGKESPLDSMAFIDLCLVLQDIAKANGFEFDWSGKTMEENAELFSSISSLVNEFSAQSSLKDKQ